MERKVIEAGTTSEFLYRINENFKYLFEGVPQILAGTGEPNLNMGKTGDIYIQYENET